MEVATLAPVNALKERPAAVSASRAEAPSAAAKSIVISFSALCITAPAVDPTVWTFTLKVIFSPLTAFTSHNVEPLTTFPVNNVSVALLRKFKKPVGTPS
ncbi:hypothetical protein SDC9_162593 [bioreactor metagenome]|uniref:Uncharacterized protein n=1 Tax=bioreactor metagenome TaxID=1076179 RepID=A0A645FT51_9ZZZZ